MTLAASDLALFSPDVTRSILTAARLLPYTAQLNDLSLHTKTGIEGTSILHKSVSEDAFLNRNIIKKIIRTDEKNTHQLTKM